MAYAAQLSFRDLEEKPDLVMISPNDPGAMSQYVEECRALGIPYFYDPSQQLVRLEAAVVRRGIEGTRALFVNEYEFGLVQKMTGMARDEILEHVEFLVVTMGAHGTRIYTAQDELVIPAVPEKKIADPTGVGDAFRGGFLAGIQRGWGLEMCGKMGALAATYCLEQYGPQGHAYTPAEFVARFRQHFDDGGLLDQLL